MMEDNDYFMHYGVLGMKWGVRKDRKSSSLKRSGKKTSAARILYSNYQIR